MSEIDWKAWFEKFGTMWIHDPDDPFGCKISVEGLYDAFKARMKVELLPCEVCRCTPCHCAALLAINQQFNKWEDEMFSPEKNTPTVSEREEG